MQQLVLPLGVRVGDRLPPVLAVDEVVHHARLQGAGTKQRHQGDDVLEAVRSQALDQVLHTAGFQLEYRRGLRRLQQLEAGLVIQRDLADIQRQLALPLPHGINHFHRPVDNRQGAQAEKVELDQARVLHVALVVLGDQATAGFVAKQRGEIRQFRGRNNHTPGMLAHVAGNALQLHRHIPDFLGLGVIPQEIPQGLFLLQGLGQGHPHFKRESSWTACRPGRRTCPAPGPRRAPPPWRPWCRR